MAISHIPTLTMVLRLLACQARLQALQMAVQDPRVTRLQLHRQWQPAYLPRQHLTHQATQGREGTVLLHFRCTRQMSRGLHRSRVTRASRSRPSGLLKLWQRDSQHRLQHLLHLYLIHPAPGMGRRQEEDHMPTAVSAPHPLPLHHQPQHQLKIL